MKTFFLICPLSIVLALAVSCSRPSPPRNLEPSKTNPPPVAAVPSTNEVAVLETSEGKMVVEFWPDTAPNTVENFKKLARQGFYDGTCFHRIMDGFMIQGGDPNTKDPAKEGEWGFGGPGYTIKDEISTRPDRRHIRGVISMANYGRPDSAGSQFFICLATVPYLDGGYSSFGKLIKGDDVLARIGGSPVKADPHGEMSRPVKRVELKSVKIVPADSVK